MKIPLCNLKVIYRGRMVTASNNLSEYKLEEDCVLHCMGKPLADGEQLPDVTAPSLSAPTIPESAPTSTSAPVSHLHSVLANCEMKRSVDNTTWNTALSTLQKMLDRVISNPNEEKYRKVKKQNAAFQKRIGGLTGSDELMTAAGFVSDIIEGEAYYFIKPSVEAWPKLLEAQENISAAVSSPVQQLQPSTFVPPSSSFGAPTNPTGNIDSMAMNMLQNPQALQGMLSNPMIQQQMMNDPRIANNPMMRQSLEEMSSDPARLQQLSQIMSNPATRQMMSQMANNYPSPAGGIPSFRQSDTSNTNTMNPEARHLQTQQLAQMMTQMSNAVNQNGTSQNNSAANSGNGTEMTEEDMINEAIARSLSEM